MFDDYKKPIMSICLWLSVLLTTFACALGNNVGGGNSLPPIRNFTLTFDKSQREDFFDQLQKFAEQHGFGYQITDFNTNGKYFQFYMSRKDMMIIASNVPPDPTLVYISFYGKYPEAQVDEEVVDKLVSDLKDFINEIPNVTITEEK